MGDRLREEVLVLEERELKYEREGRGFTNKSWNDKERKSGGCNNTDKNSICC